MTRSRGHDREGVLNSTGSEERPPEAGRPAREGSDLSAIRSAGRAIAPLHGPIAEVREGDWLDVHEEPGQSFDEYLNSDPVIPSAVRTTMYVQPLGAFDPARAVAVEATAAFLGAFYGVPVRSLERMELAWVPHWARRLHPFTGEEQVLTKAVLRLLGRKKPADAVAVLALTTSDLWPGKGWNFVFGQASLRKGVGVWSLHRLGDPRREPETFLLRTVKIAVHETGHMLGIRHCTGFSCGMNGANHRDEADNQPLWFCPEDEMKIWWGCRAVAIERYRRLAELAARYGLEREADFWRRSERAVEEDLGLTTKVR
jgi:archaemetzincin